MVSILRKIESYYKLKTPIIWKNLIFISMLHLFAIYGIFLLPTAKVLTLFWAWTLGTLANTGVTLGVHRLWTHGSYKANLLVRIALMLCYTLTGQYSIVQWVRDHRTHHLYTDTDADPHSASRGFFYSHVGWLVVKRHPDCKTKGRNVDVSDLYKDPVVRFHQKHFYLLVLFVHIIFPSALAYYVIGDTLKNAVFIVLFLRSVIALNIVWCINSLAHYLENKPYNKDILASQVNLFSLFSLGEGGHNFHHVFPFDYRIGEFGQEYLIGTWVIDQFARFGWVTNRRTVSPKEVIRVKENNSRKIQEQIKEQKEMGIYQ